MNFMNVEPTMEEFYEEWNSNHQQLQGLNWNKESLFPQIEIQPNQFSIKENIFEQNSAENLLSTNQSSNIFSENTLELDFFSSGSVDDSDPTKGRKILQNALTYVENFNSANEINNNCNQYQSNTFNPFNTMNTVQCIPNLNNQESFLKKFQFNNHVSTAATSPIDSHSMEEERISQGSTPSRTSSQNPRRNMPVLVFQRVIAGCKEVLRPTRNHGGRLSYLREIIYNCLRDNQDRQGFIEFLDSFTFGNKRTWAIIKDQLEINGKNRFHIKALLECTKSFLSQIGEQDFENWLFSGKIRKESNKIILRESKQWFIEEFKSIGASFPIINKSI